MGTFGGRRALTHVCALVALCLPAAALTGCSAALDQAHSVQTKLGRIDEIVDASVATPSEDTGAAIAVTYADADGARELADLLTEIDKVADDAEYPSYRLDLTPAGSAGDRLTVDDTFVDSADQTDVLENWFAVTTALLGPVQYSSSRAPSRSRSSPAPASATTSARPAGSTTASRTRPGPSSTARPRSSRPAGSPRPT